MTAAPDHVRAAVADCHPITPPAPGAAAVVDTFPAFMAWWSGAQHLSLDAQIDSWAAGYMSNWPELLEKQIAEYVAEGGEWRRVAREHVFPFWSARLASIQRAHRNLLSAIQPVVRRADETLGLPDGVVVVVYVGIGCGAGWATTYVDRPAVLVGLENVAEEHWDDETSLAGLLSHELGHVWHFTERRRAGLPLEDGPWWHLYTEGVAQRSVQLMAGGDTRGWPRHGTDWVRWCERKRGWLAQEFLRAAVTGEDVRPFFGSWLSVRGHSATGYFLGVEVVRQLEATMTLRDIACLQDVEAVVSGALEAIAAA